MSTLHHRAINLSFLSLLLMAFFLPISESLTSLCFVLSVIFSLLSGAAWRYRNDLIKHPIILALWLMLVVIVLGLTYGHAVSDPQTWRLLEKYLWIVLTPWLLLAIRQSAQRQSIFFAFLYGNALVLLLSLFMLLKGLLAGHAVNPCVFRGHIPQNFYMSFCSAIWLYCAIRRPQHRRLMALLFVFSAISVFAVSSRTGYVNWVLLVALVSLTQLPWRQSLIILLSSLVLLVSLTSLSPVFTARTSQAVSEVSQHVEGKDGKHATSMGIRAVQLSSGLQIFRQHPLFGVGTGGASAAFEQLPAKTRNERLVNSRHTVVDLTYVNVMVEHGLLGLLALLVFITIIVRCSLRLKSPWCSIGLYFTVAYFTAALFTPFLVSSFAVDYFVIMLVVLFSGEIVKKPLKSHHSEVSAATEAQAKAN